MLQNPVPWITLFQISSLTQINYSRPPDECVFVWLVAAASPTKISLMISRPHQAPAGDVSTLRMSGKSSRSNGSSFLRSSYNKRR